MSNKVFLKMLFLVGLVFLSTSVVSATFNVSNTPQLRQALLDAALNGQHDTIILAAGVYKTTSDGLGRFRFSDAEDFSLMVTGATSNSGDVILDGDGIDPVLSLKNSQDQDLYSAEVKNLTIRNGVDTSDSCGGLDVGFDEVYLTNISVLNNEEGICTPLPYVTYGSYNELCNKW